MRYIKQIIAISLIATFLICCNEKSEKFGKSIESLRNEVQPKLDTQLDAIAAKNNLYRRVAYLIKHEELSKATELLDSLTTVYGRDGQSFVYRGIIYQKLSNYDSALIQYNKAMEDQKFPFALAKRADLYVEEKNYHSALEDYRAAYEINFDYSKELGRIFGLMKMKDSAIKYYSEYLEHYPDDSSAQQELAALRGRGTKLNE